MNACHGSWCYCHLTVALESWIGQWAKPSWGNTHGLLLASYFHAGPCLQASCPGSNCILQTSIITSDFVTPLFPDITSGAWTLMRMKRADGWDLRRVACQVSRFMVSDLISLWPTCWCWHSALPLPFSPLHHFLPPETRHSHSFCCYSSITISTSLNKLLMPLFCFFLVVVESFYKNLSKTDNIAVKQDLNCSLCFCFLIFQCCPQAIFSSLPVLEDEASIHTVLPCSLGCDDTTQPTWVSVLIPVNENNNSTYRIRLLWGLSEFIHVKPLEQCLAHSKGSVLAIIVAIIIIIIISGFSISYLCNFQSQLSISSFCILPPLAWNVNMPSMSHWGQRRWVARQQKRRASGAVAEQDPDFRLAWATIILWICQSSGPNFLTIHRLSFLPNILLWKFSNLQKSWMTFTIISVYPSSIFYNC